MREEDKYGEEKKRSRKRKRERCEATRQNRFWTDKRRAGIVKGTETRREMQREKGKSNANKQNIVSHL